MKKLRQQFWKGAKNLVTWCCDEELRVLRQMAAKELEERLNKELHKLDLDMEKRASKLRTTKKARARNKQRSNSNDAR